MSLSSFATLTSGKCFSFELRQRPGKQSGDLDGNGDPQIAVPILHALCMGHQFTVLFQTCPHHMEKEQGMLPEDDLDWQVRHLFLCHRPIFSHIR